MIDSLKIEHIDIVDSTSSELKRRILSSSVETCSILIAESQTAGRGRRGRTWLNTEDALMMSVAIPVGELNSKDLPLISHAAALAVFNAISQLDGFDGLNNSGIKWPNDILLEGKKICGILSEIVNNTCGIMHVIIGIGVNVNADSFPSGLLQPITSIKQVFGYLIDKNLLCERIIIELLMRLEILLSNNSCDLIAEYRKHCITLGKAITVYPNSNYSYEAFANDVDSEGRLIIIDSSGREDHVNSADVSVRWAITSNN